MKHLLFCFILIFSSLTFAKMTSLSGGPSKGLAEFNENDVFIFFQSGCGACHALMKDLKCLAKEYNINLLGSISKVHELKKEYKQYNVPYPAYFADPYTMAELTIIEVPATPQVIRWTKPKPKLVMGLRPCKEYLKKLR